MGNPIIGVFADTMSCNKGGFGDVTRQYINAAYISAVEDAGAVPFIIPVSNDLEKTKKLIDLCDGLLFPGGKISIPAITVKILIKIWEKSVRK